MLLNSLNFATPFAALVLVRPLSGPGPGPAPANSSLIIAPGRLQKAAPEPGGQPLATAGPRDVVLCMSSNCIDDWKRHAFIGAPVAYELDRSTASDDASRCLLA